MTLDDAQLRAGLRSLHGHLAPAEASAIFDVARLAAAADKQTDIGEVAVLLALARIVFEIAGMKEMPVPTTAIDASRLRSIGGELVATGARELAFACAFVVMIHDRDLTKDEGELAGRLSEALMITPERAHQLALNMDALVRAARRR